MESQKYKLAILATHPIQYQAPFFQKSLEIISRWSYEACEASILKVLNFIKQNV